MPIPEPEIIETKTRVEWVMKLFPQVSRTQATQLDAFLVKRLENLLEAVIADAPEFEGMQKEVIQALGILYIKSNIDELFKAMMDTTNGQP